MKLAIVCTTVLLLCSSGKVLLSKNTWKLATSNLSSKDDKKLGLVHTTLRGVSAYEDLKQKYVPGNTAPWGFLKHLETKAIVVPYGVHTLPQNVVDAAAASRVEDAVNAAFEKHEKNKEMIPFVHCVSKCFDLSKMLQRAHKNGNSELLAFFVSSNIDVQNFLNREDKWGCVPLSETCDYEWARVLILLGADLEASDKYQFTALLRQMNANVVKLLLDAGADVDAKCRFGKTALHYAVERNKIEIAKMLIKAGARKSEQCNFLLNDRPVHKATSLNKLDFIKLLVDEGVDIDERNGIGGTSLHVAAMHDRVEAAKLLIELGVDIEARDDYQTTPLLQAVSSKSPGAVKLLLAEGADIDAKCFAGMSALHMAVQKDQIDIAKMLIRAGAKKNEQDKNSNDMPLHKAAAENKLDFIKLLVNEGAYTEGRNGMGETALCTAVRNEKIEAAKLLIKLGANVEPRDKFGKKPIESTKSLEMKKLFSK